jgi:hypothetical protein
LIEEFAPGAPPITLGGRGNRAPGRGICHARELDRRRNAKYPTAENETIVWASTQRRKRGAKLTTRILSSKMRQCMLNHYPPEAAAFKASTGWFSRFCARYGLRQRRKNDNAKKPLKTLIPEVALHINQLRKFRRSHPAERCETWGKFGPRETLNVDQVPMAFASSDGRTWEFGGVQRVWIRAPGSGLDKRQCTLMLTIRAQGKQPLPVLIFRGTPTHLVKGEKRKAKRAAEEARYSKYCRVMWQKKAWADTETMERWSKEELGMFLREEGIEDSILLADNLNAQVVDGFRRGCRAYGARLWLGPKNATHVWQPADHHVGAAYKKIMGDCYDDFMLAEIEQYTAGKVKTVDVRVLLTQWAGKAYLDLEAKRREREAAVARDPAAKPSLFYGAFMSTGNLVTRNGLHDEKIKPHKGIVDDLEVQFRGLLHKAELPPPPFHPFDADAERDGDDALAPGEAAESFIIQLSDTSDSEDVDDELEWQSDGDLQLAEADRNDDEWQSEGDLELEFDDEEPDEAGAIAAAAEQAPPEQVRDFHLARRIANEVGVNHAPAYTAVAPTVAVAGRRQSTRTRYSRSGV